MFQATEGRWGIARGRDHRRRAASARTASRGTSSSRASPSAVRLTVRAPRSRSTDFVFGVGIFNVDGVCCYGTNTDIEELDGRSDSRARATVTLPHRRPRPRRGHLQARRRRAPARRLPVRLPPAALQLPREVAHEGRRHLPPAARVGVLGRHRFKDSVATEQQRIEAPRRSVLSAESRRLAESPDPTPQLTASTEARSCRCRVPPPTGLPSSARRPARRLHQRRLRPAAPGPRPLPRRRARPGRRADRRRQLRPLGARHQGARRARSTPSTSAPRSSRRSPSWTPSSIFDEDDPHAIITAIQPDVLVKGADWAADQHRRPRHRRGPRRPGRPHPVRAGILDDGYHREDPRQTEPNAINGHDTDVSSGSAARSRRPGPRFSSPSLHLSDSEPDPCLRVP